MTPDKVEREVKRIIALHKTNVPAAALAEVALYRRLLTAIAEGRAQSPTNCAAIAMRLWLLGMHRPVENEGGDE